MRVERQDVGDRGVHTDRGHHLGVLGDAPTVTDRALRGQPLRGPRGATADQVVDLFEPELSEPTRGPSAEVSMLIEAVQEQRRGALERVDLRRFELLQR